MDESKDNSGECVFSVAGSIRGIRITLLGGKDQIIDILKIAIMKSPAMKEILAGLKDRESDGRD